MTTNYTVPHNRVTITIQSFSSFGLLAGAADGFRAAAERLKAWALRAVVYFREVRAERMVAIEREEV